MCALDANHLIAIGDEGNEKLLGIEAIDVGTLHTKVWNGGCDAEGCGIRGMGKRLVGMV